LITQSDFTRDISRLTLYHNIFKYRVSLDIDGIEYFKRAKTYEQFIEVCEFITPSRFIHGKTIQKFVDWRGINDPEKFMVRISHGSLNVYFNEFNIINDLLNRFTDAEKKHQNTKYLYCEPMANYDKGVLYRVNPKHKYRIYMKSRRYTNDERKELLSYLSNKNVHFAESMMNWFYMAPDTGSAQWFGFRSGTIWSYTSNFFDFDDESLITMLYLKYPDLIGKVFEIQQKINT